MTPKIAVCAPCWNQVQYTQWFVESVRKNSGDHDVRLILLDNGSVDSTREYIRSVGATTIELEENVGVNPAWNRLLAAAVAMGADVICLANNDIIVGPEWLDSVVAGLADPKNMSYFVANGFFDCDQVAFDDVVRLRLPLLRGQRYPGRGGWCMFFTPAMVRKFHPIPAELTLWFGDDWIHHKLGEVGYKCEALMDSCALHFLSKSVTEYPDKIATIARDREAFARLMQPKKETT